MVFSTTRCVALATLACLSLAQDNVVIHGSVIFSRTGERLPLAYEETHDVIQLSSLGAQQSYAAGSAFRARYMTDGSSTAIAGLSPSILDPGQIYTLTVDDTSYQFYIASVQAFMQGLYPPTTLNQTGSTDLLNGDDILSNSSYQGAPLNGYQYPWVHAPTSDDPASIFVQGYAYCPNFDNLASDSASNPAYKAKASETQSFYTSVGRIASDEVLSLETYSYGDAYIIWDYLSYQYTHNSTVLDQFTTGTLAEDDAYARLRYLSDEQEWALYANNTADGGADGDAVSVIGGQLFAAEVLGLLQGNIDNQGGQYKLSVILGEFPVFMSFFSLAGLPSVSADFMGMPDWASSMVFELFSFPGATTIGDGSDFPIPDDLYVRFLFQNGTSGSNTNDTANTLTVYPIFGRGQDYLPWNTFYEVMSTVMVSDVASWCAICDSWTTSIFCPAFNDSLITSTQYVYPSGVSPKIAGVIGAVATLSAIGLILILAVCLGGLRFKRVGKKRPDSSLGGFKGGQKLASDPDLTLPKGSAGASVVPVQGKERVSSWELKNADGSPRFAQMDRPSMEHDERVDPFADPVRPEERV